VRHFMKPPTELGGEEIKVFLQSLQDRGCSPSTLCVYRAGLQFLYGVTLLRPEVMLPVPHAKVRQNRPRVLSGSEIERLIAAISSRVHRAIFIVTYSAGLRISETCALELGDIKSESGVIRIRDGKGSKDRFAKLSPRALAELRAYWTETRPRRPWLFPGRSGDKPISTHAFRRHLASVSEQLGIKPRVTPHQLRHSYATHMLSLGADVRILQFLLGHAEIRSTEHYLSVTVDYLRQTESPFDTLGGVRAKVLG